MTASVVRYPRRPWNTKMLTHRPPRMSIRFSLVTSGRASLYAFAPCAKASKLSCVSQSPILVGGNSPVEFSANIRDCGQESFIFQDPFGQLMDNLDFLICRWIIRVLVDSTCSLLSLTANLRPDITEMLIHLPHLSAFEVYISSVHLQ